MSSIPRSADYLVNLVLSTPALKQDVQSHPDDTLRQLAEQVTKELPPSAWAGDKWIFRMVIGALSAVAIIAMIAAMRTTGAVPDVITALGSAAIGALAGILAPSPANHSN